MPLLLNGVKLNCWAVATVAPSKIEAATVRLKSGRRLAERSETPAETTTLESARRFVAHLKIKAAGRTEPTGAGSWSRSQCRTAEFRKMCPDRRIARG